MFVAILICYALVSYFLYPETKGYSLENMALLFDAAQATGFRAGENSRRLNLSEEGTEKGGEAVEVDLQVSQESQPALVANLQRFRIEAINQYGIERKESASELPYDPFISI